MAGDWELRLQRLAEGGSPWDVPTRAELAGGLTALKHVLDRVASDPGLVGRAGRSAQAAFSATASQVSRQIDYVEDQLPRYLQEANDVRSRARESLASLPNGEMSPGQEAAVRAAAVGSTLVLGPVAFLAGEGAAGAINSYMAGRREEEAQKKFAAHSNELDEIEVARAPVFRPRETPDDDDPPQPVPVPQPQPQRRSQERSFEQYPDWNVSPADPHSGDNGGPAPSGEPPRDADALPGRPPAPDYGPFPAPLPIGIPPIDLENLPGVPTPDGPISGSPTLPGVIPSAPGGGGLVGTPNGPGAGLGSGLAAGLVAGGGGALALGRLGNAAAPGGSLFGGGAGGAGGAAGGAARGGGLLGKTAGAGSGLGTRGVGGLAGAGGGTSGSSTARGAGMRGVGGAGTAGGGAASGGSRGAAGGSRGVGGIGGPGSRSDRKDEAARGLGGPIAPRMEDDEEIGPRSENAQAGGRDDADRNDDDV